MIPIFPNLAWFLYLQLYLRNKNGHQMALWYAEEGKGDVYVSTGKSVSMERGREGKEGGRQRESELESPEPKDTSGGQGPVIPALRKPRQETPGKSWLARLAKLAMSRSRKRPRVKYIK